MSGQAEEGERSKTESDGGREGWKKGGNDWGIIERSSEGGSEGRE